MPTDGQTDMTKLIGAFSDLRENRLKTKLLKREINKFLATSFYIYLFIQGCTNPGCEVAVATKSCTVAPNNCVSSVWELASCHPYGA